MAPTEILAEQHLITLRDYFPAKNLVFLSGKIKGQVRIKALESISDNTDEIYNLWKTDKMLRKKNDFVANIFLRQDEDFTFDEQILLSFFANQILEGMYFYAGFSAMYALGKSGKMLGSTDMIKFIQRDEVTHLLLFQNMINACRKERPEMFTAKIEAKVRKMIVEAVEVESEWGAYITQGQILGLSDAIIRQYIEYLADARLTAIGYAKMKNRLQTFGEFLLVFYDEHVAKNA